MQKILLFLDYDGTLTPIVKRPELAILEPQARHLLKKLSRKVKLCVISGRSLADIKKLIKLKGIIFAGNHGLEIDYNGRLFIHPSALRFRHRLDNILVTLKEKLKDIPGIFIEDKGATVSVHYRNVKNKYIEKIKNTFKISYGARITRGKKVFEVRPPVRWDKGMAVKKIIGLAGGNCLPIYIGDDTTDEDAFRALKKRGLAIFVGRPQKTAAKYYLKNTKDVVEFLKHLLWMN